MTEWFEEWFGEEYLRLYPHRDDAEAARAVRLIGRTVGLSPGWRVLDVACGAGRHAKAFQEVGARCIGLDLSASLLGVARTVTDAALVRADMRRLPIRPESMDLTVNLFTSFGYFERDAEHAAAIREMIGTLRSGGWFVIDFLNPEAVRATLVPAEKIGRDGGDIHVTRSVSADGRHVCKTIDAPGGRRFTERVRLFEHHEITALLQGAGLVVREGFGDYDAGPLAPMSPRTILMGQVA